MVDKKYCTGCTACYEICPAHAIKMEPDQEGFLYPIIEELKCIHCNLCDETCPVVKDNKRLSDSSPITYAACSLNDEIRLKSSSGGVFTELAEYILDVNGVVIGCSMSADCKKAVHILVENRVDLENLRGSKYLQSDLQGVFHKIQEYLNENRFVLFSGTPCQVSGLKAYLGNKKYDNLYTIDVICHGVPSPYIWKKYVEFRETEAQASVRRTIFRHKKYGWKLYSVLFDFLNSTEYTEPLTKDLYMKGFLANLFLRPSCYKCKFKGENYASDVTLADFWGVENVAPEMDDNKGTSLVIIHTLKGDKIFKEIFTKLKVKKIDRDRALESNPSYYSSVQENHLRKGFYRDIKKQSFDKVIEKYCGQSIMSRIRRLVFDKICH